jgi:hypothetical protein
VRGLVAERVPVEIISDPEKAKIKWDEIGETDFCRLILAIMANPTLRDEAWDALGDNGNPVLSGKLKFWLTVHAVENDRQAV